MPSRVRFHQHGAPHADLIGWMGVYRAHTPGVRVGDNCSIRLDLDNEPQPDGALIVLPEYGGQAEIDSDGYIVGGPELLGEVSGSSVSIDLTKKARVYRRNEVREYVVWRVEDQVVDWFSWKNAQFERLPQDANGLYQSEVFAGLWLDPAALVRGDMAQVLAVLQQGIATTEHAAFVAKLQKHFSRTF
jgi:Uma2 family endonuclease